jgi:hypothetical protein
VAESARCVLGAFSDKVPECHSLLWEMVLSYLRALPDAWLAVDVRKVVLPRLWAFLRCEALRTAVAGARGL